MLKTSSMQNLTLHTTLLKGYKMNIYKKLSIHLAENPKMVFSELKNQFESKHLIPQAIELLYGLLEKNLPHYFQSDLPYWDTIYNRRDKYKEDALYFLKKNEGLLYSVLLDENVNLSQKENLFYLLAKYLPESGASCNSFLRLGAVALYMAHIKIGTQLGRLATQALCRYNLQPLARTSGLELLCDEKPPYKNIALLCMDGNKIDPFCQIFFYNLSPDIVAQVEKELQSLPRYITIVFITTLEEYVKELSKFKL